MSTPCLPSASSRISGNGVAMVPFGVAVTRIDSPRFAHEATEFNGILADLQNRSFETFRHASALPLPDIARFSGNHRYAGSLARGIYVTPLASEKTPSQDRREGRVDAACRQMFGSHLRRCSLKHALFVVDHCRNEVPAAEIAFHPPPRPSSNCY